MCCSFACGNCKVLLKVMRWISSWAKVLIVSSLLVEGIFRASREIIASALLFLFFSIQFIFWSTEKCHQNSMENFCATKKVRIAICVVIYRRVIVSCSNLHRSMEQKKKFKLDLIDVGKKIDENVTRLKKFKTFLFSSKDWLDLPLKIRNICFAIYHNKHEASADSYIYLDIVCASFSAQRLNTWLAGSVKAVS
jgi:hypothetical protein